MVIATTSATPAPTTVSTSGAESSRYTATVDRYVKILDGGGTPSFDEQIEAFQGSMKLLFGVDESGESGILFKANKKDCQRLSDSLMSSDVMKRAWAAEARHGQIYLSMEPEIIRKEENGEGRSAEKVELDVLSKMSIEDQKLFFTACGNHSIDARISTERFSSFDDYKTLLKTKADAFARDQAKRPAASALPGAAPEASSASNALGKADNGKASKTKSGGKTQGVTTLTAKPALASAPPTAGMINAAVALQVLQAAADANKASALNEQAHRSPAQTGTSNSITPPLGQEASVKLRV